ncbi:MAG: cupin domain-containing protein, partial [Nocardioides sp.]
MTYYVPRGGLPGQDELTTDRAVFTEAYAVLPRGTMRDIVTSRFPHWDDTRAWVLARPLSGFAETFSWYVAEVGPGGGNDVREEDGRAEGVLFVVDGSPTLHLPRGESHELRPGSYAFLPPNQNWWLRNHSQEPATLHWIRKAYESVHDVDVPDLFVTHEDDVALQPMPGTDAWSTQRFVDPDDVRHDMHVNIVTFRPGAVIPFAETHVM